MRTVYYRSASQLFCAQFLSRFFGPFQPDSEGYEKDGLTIVSIGAILVNFNLFSVNFFSLFRRFFLSLSMKKMRCVNGGR